MGMKTRALAAAFSTAVVLVALAAPAGAGVVTPAPDEHLTFSFTSFDGTNLAGYANATGVVNGVGTVTAGEGDVFPATVVLPQGKLRLKVATAPGAHDFLNPQTCAFAFDSGDTIKVKGGTGVFKGATGTGTDKVSGALIFAKNGDGTCNFDVATKVGITVRAELDLHLAP